MAKKKCVICGQYIEAADKTVPYKNREAHVICFNNMVKIAKKEKDKELAEKVERKKTTSARPKAELKDALSEEEYKQKMQYFDYLKQLTGQEKLSAKIYKLSDIYIKKYEFTYLGMYRTLYYIFKLCNRSVEGDCIGLIPYYYDEALKLYNSYEKALESNEDVQIDEIYKQTVIKMRPPKVIRSLIDIGGIE